MFFFFMQKKKEKKMEPKNLIFCLNYQELHQHSDDKGERIESLQGGLREACSCSTSREAMKSFAKHSCLRGYTTHYTQTHTCTRIKDLGNNS